MKFLLSWLLLLTSSFGMAQSPAYNIVLQMNDSTTPYTIEMKFCQPEKHTKIRSWFAHDTSKISWETLQPADYACGTYFTGELSDNMYNSFKAANQKMLWENILVFKIASRSNSKQMYILVPIFIQSFVTSVIIKDVPFKPGIYELDDLQTTINGMRITMQKKEEQAWIDRSAKRKFKTGLE